MATSQQTKFLLTSTAHTHQHRNAGPVVLYLWEPVAVASSVDFHPLGFDGYNNHSFWKHLHRLQKNNQTHFTLKQIVQIFFLMVSV